MTAALHDDYPPPGEWTTDDLDALPDDGRRHELLDGTLLMSPSPTRLHQSIALDPVKRVYVEQARMTDGILLPEPWEVDVPLARITPRRA